MSVRFSLAGVNDFSGFFSDMTLLVKWQEGHIASKNLLNFLEQMMTQQLHGST